MKWFVVVMIVVMLAACASRGGREPAGPVAPSTVLDHKGTTPTVESNYTEGPAGFPIPKDAATVEDTPPDHTFKVPRKQPEIAAEIKVNLAQMGFTVVDEYLEDRSHTHWYITKGTVVYKVTVAGDSGDRTLIILTLD